MSGEPTQETDVSGGIEEEAVYVNTAAKEVDETSDQKKFLSFPPSFPPVAGCWVILIIIVSLRIYFTSIISENVHKLTAENQQLRALTLHLNNQTTSPDGITEKPGIKITDLTVENQNLKTQNQQLAAKNQQLMMQNRQLETQRNKLTEKIKEMETEWDKLNVSRAQWSLDQYCPLRGYSYRRDVRQCQPCQVGWSVIQSSCFAVSNDPPDKQLTWDEAQADCKEKNSDLAVLNHPQWSYFFNRLGLSPTKEYWIGLRAEGRKWKWVDGRDLTNTTWIQPPSPADGLCAISVGAEQLKSVNCGVKNKWICGKKAVTVDPIM